MPRHSILRVKSIIKITTKLFWNNSDFHDKFMVIPLKIPTVYAFTNHQNNLTVCSPKIKSLKIGKKNQFYLYFSKNVHILHFSLHSFYINNYLHYLHLHGFCHNVEIIIYNTINSRAIILWQSRRKNDLKIYMNDMIQRG